MNETFTLDEPERIRASFEDKGFVGIRGILSEEECLQTREDIGRQMKELAPAFDLDDPSTYDHAPINPNYGVVGRAAMFSPRFLYNRQHPNVFQAFTLLADDPNLLISHDRCAFYRPTRQIPFRGQIVDKPEWKTEYTYPGVHLDFNPGMYHSAERVIAARERLDYSSEQDWTSENSFYCDRDGQMLQAVLNLEDNRVEDGGYHGVPGFHRRFEEWLLGLHCDDPSPAGLYRFSAGSAHDCRYASHPIRVPAPAGSLIIWDQRLAHGTLPNDSNRGRLIQFLKVFPRRIVSASRYRARRQALTAILKTICFHDVSEIGRTLFGLESLA
jgi:hypothetical protein